MDIQIDKIYPALYHAADNASLKGQKNYLLSFKAQLWVLIFASFIGLFQTDNPEYGKYIAAISLIFFVIGTFVSYNLQTSPYDSDWYYGRAIAESIKTLTWRFIVRGEPFLFEENDKNVEKKYLELLNKILEDNKGFLKITIDNSEQISSEMRKIRSLELSERKNFYTAYRVKEQLDWYKRKSTFNENKKNIYSILIITANLIALIFSVVLILNNNIFNITPFIVTIASVLISWQQVKHFGDLSQAYAITAHEISMILNQVDYNINDNDFSVFVGDSENAFSREHTLWLARRDAYYIVKVKK